MELYLDNEIDKKLSSLYPKEVLENAKIGVIDYLGMNITEEKDSDIIFKIYYDDLHSREEYETKYKNDPLIDFLYERDMVFFLEIVRDKDNTECTRFNVGLKNLTNDNVLALFAWMEENISFFPKYKDEIFKLSEIKRYLDEGYKYSSFFFIGIVKNETGVVQVLKCYWLNKNREPHKIFSDENHLNFLENCGVEKFKELIPLTKEAIKNCGRHLCMTGIDYNAECSEKHKLYVDYPTDVYGGLIKTFPDNEELKKKIILIRDWHEIHNEFYCDGFTIGKDMENKLVLNIYFKFKKESQK